MPNCYSSQRLRIVRQVHINIILLTRKCTNCENNVLQMGKSPYINSNRERVLDPLTAFRLQSMMRGVVERGTAKSVEIKGVEIAGKTGTTNDAKDVWFVGFTRNIVAGCFIGFDTPKPLRKGASGGRKISW